MFRRPARARRPWPAAARPTLTRSCAGHRAIWAGVRPPLALLLGEAVPDDRHRQRVDAEPEVAGHHLHVLVPRVRGVQTGEPRVTVAVPPGGKCRKRGGEGRHLLRCPGEFGQPQCPVLSLHEAAVDDPAAAPHGLPRILSGWCGTLATDRSERPW